MTRAATRTASLDALLDATDRLNRAVSKLRFVEPVTHVYNPLEYAGASYKAYLMRYAVAPREILMLGMNPGPWGMAQTGVPFGEVSMVRDWLGIREAIGRPKREHPKRPVQGLSCSRSEVSGLRLWGWARDRFRTPASFFARFFVGNYCPLTFLEETGRNRTPDKLSASERDPLFAACDAYLRALVASLQPRVIVGVGAFAEGRAKAALDGADVQIGRMLHPSPASPAANRDWAACATRDLEKLGISLR